MNEYIVLYLTPSVRLLGARRSLLSLVKNLSPPFKPFVVCSNSGPLTEELIKLNIPAKVVKHYNWRKGKYFFHRYLQVYQLSKLIDEIKPSIIHSNEIYSLPSAIKARGKQKIPIVVHNRLKITPRQIKNYYLSKADRIIAVSKASADDFAHCNFKDRVCMVYNGLDLKEFSPDKSLRDKTRQKLGFAVDDFVCGIIGLIGERKRQHIAIQSAKIVIHKNRKCHFLFVGDPPASMKDYSNAIKKDCELSGLSKNVHFLPFQSNIKPLYSALDLNLLISSEEGFGRTIIEAGAMEIPSIGTRIGGIPELIINNLTGYLIVLDDINKLSDIILDCANNPEKLKEMGLNARKIIEENFSIQKHCNAIQLIYLELLGIEK